MPELPDVTFYVESLNRHLAGRRLVDVRATGPSLLQTVEPPLEAFAGRRATGFRRLGKRIAMEFEGELFLVLHLMIAGRLRWRPDGGGAPGKIGQAVFTFENGRLLVTEAGTRKRATLHAVRGEGGLDAFRPGGVEPLECDLAAFRASLGRESHTLKRALTDPRLVSGIGNAYSDEILHRARLSPLLLTGRLDDAGWERLFAAVGDVLREWIERLRAGTGDGFPGTVTAFREGMAVHGRYGKPCPDCGSPVQRIRYAGNETDYCAACQTGGRLLADRALSRLLKGDWPRTLDELERPGPA